MKIKIGKEQVAQGQYMIGLYFDSEERKFYACFFRFCLFVGAA